MRRTLVTYLQWWMFLALNAITWTIVPHLRDFPWWGLVLFGAGYYAAVIAIFRLDWESSSQAYERRKDARHCRWLRKYQRDEARKAQADRDAWLRQWGSR